jgi:amino acid adenylation domain-containing protein
MITYDTSNLPVEQQNIRDKCFHPDGEFIEFNKEEIEQSIPERFEEIVQKYSNRIAVKTQNHALTYNELNQTANRIARAILARHGENNEPTAMLFEHGASAIAAIIGLLKAAKFYLPLDPSYPLAKLRFMLEDSQAISIVTNYKNLHVAQELSQNRLPVINIEDVNSSFSTEKPSIYVPSDFFAYIFYTSGSTGRPKGVVDTHRNVLHNIMRYTNSLHICAADRLSLLQSCSFSGSVSSLFCALLNGGAVFPFDIHKEGLGNLGAWLVKDKITIYHSVPSIFRHLATRSEQFPKLRVIRLEGDQMSHRDVMIFTQNFSSNCILVNGLGATECGLVRQYFMDKQIKINHSVVPIGYDVEDMEITLIDEAGNDVGDNCVGEIAVRSSYLATGYWKKSDLTREAFKKVPHRSNLRIYRTGDLGRMRTDGCLEYLGRNDFLMKIRGQRVDVAEIETKLLELSAIKEVAIQTYNDSSGESRLVAYVVTDRKPTPTISMLRRHLGEQLPSATIPSAFVVLDCLPLTSNGKLNRRALPPPNWQRPELDSIYVAPNTQMEKLLAKIWTDVLGLDQIGINDNFFDLGGDSLRALEVVCAIDSSLGRALSPEVMARASTISELAILLENTECVMTSSLVPIRSRGSRPPLFCVPGVAGSALAYWSLARHLNPDQPVFAFEPAGLDGIKSPDQDVETMATRYISDMRKMLPNGPYYLAGTCFGSTVAFEMARRLGEQGQEVPIIFMLGDNLIPDWVDLDMASTNRLLSIFHAVRRTLYHLFHSTLSDVIATARNELRIRFDSNLRTIRKVMDYHLAARAKHRPIAHSSGRIMLYRITVAKPAEAGQWSKLALGGLDIEHIRVPSERWMQEPYVVEVADSLNRHLDSQRSLRATESNEIQLSLVVPCYNEGAYLEASVSNLLETLNRLGLRYELIFFDDGSSENTKAQLQALLLKFSNRFNIRLIEHTTNQGRGRTVVDGIRRAVGEIVGYCDIDLEISSAYIPSALRILLERRADIVVADRRYRWIPSSFLRNTISIAYRRLVCFSFRIPDIDTAAGFKFFHRDSILPLLNKVHDPRWFWDTELTVVALDNGLRLVNLPVAFMRRQDKQSTVRLFRDTLHLLIAIARYRKRRIIDGSN